MFMPAFERCLQISHRSMAETNGLITTLAVLRYKADMGDYPQKLDGLVSNGYIKELPIDPFSDKPLSYKRVDGDFTLYSFAYDLDDDNGKHEHKWAEDGDGDYVFWSVQKTEQMD